LGSPRQHEWEISQDINDEAIASTPNFKACDPDPMEFFKALNLCKDDSEESCEKKKKKKKKKKKIVIFHLALNVLNP